MKIIKHLFFDLGKLRAIYIVLGLRTSIDVYDLFNGWYEKGVVQTSLCVVDNDRSCGHLLLARPYDLREMKWIF